MRRLLLVGCILVCSLQLARSQEDMSLLAFNADVMMNASKAEHRASAAEQFRSAFIKSLGTDGSFSNTYIELEWIRQLVAPDSMMRIFTWQVEGANANFTYYGVIQTNTGELIQLHDKRSLSSEYATYDQNTWYGALYYGVETFETKDDQKAYIVLGYNANTPKTEQKVADVLQLADGKAVFGAPVFTVEAEGTPPDTKSRIILEYNEAAVGRIQFDREQKRLIYDHIILIDGGPEGPIFVPDGSYHAFEYKDREWRFIDKLYNHAVDKPPGDGIKDDGDLLGRKKN